MENGLGDGSTLFLIRFSLTKSIFNNRRLYSFNSESFNIFEYLAAAITLSISEFIFLVPEARIFARNDFTFMKIVCGQMSLSSLFMELIRFEF